MTIPSTSPIAQPVRQCNVAWAAIDQVAEAGSAEWPVCIA